MAVTDGVDERGVDVRSEPVALVVNRHARRGKVQFAHAERALRDVGVNVVESQALPHAAQVPKFVRGLIAQGIRVIVLGSGDGTISNVVADVVDHDVVLGVLPLGTANNLARTLHIPDDLNAACQIIADGQTQKIDLGTVNGNYFVNVASIGFGAAVVAQVSHRLKRYTGTLAYAIAAAQTALTQRAFTVRLSLPNEVIETDAIHIAVANGRFYGGGIAVAPSARIDDNELIVTIFAPMTPRELVQLALHLHDGQYVRHPRVRVIRGLTSLQLEVMRGQRTQINVDGELFDALPADFGIAPKVLSVFAPGVPLSSSGAMSA